MAVSGEKPAAYVLVTIKVIKHFPKRDAACVEILYYNYQCVDTQCVTSH